MLGAPVFFLYVLLNAGGVGGAQTFYPKEDNAAGLLAFGSHPVSNIILGLSRQPCKPAGVARFASERYHEQVRC